MDGYRTSGLLHAASEFGALTALGSALAERATPLRASPTRSAWAGLPSGGGRSRHLVGAVLLGPLSRHAQVRPAAFAVTWSLMTVTKSHRRTGASLW